MAEVLLVVGKNYQQVWYNMDDLYSLLPSVSKCFSMEGRSLSDEATSWYIVILN